MARIITNHDGWEWEAHRDDYDLDDPIGHGATEREALDDLYEQWRCEEPSCDDAESTRRYRMGVVGLCLCELHKPYWAR